uniref:Hepcidin antimicrobial peptide n=1 Tax=Ursus maritimus TaxID=29073 RepID=A0A452UVU7_URSMA
MALSMRIQAACLLSLLLASLASGSVFPHQVSSQGLGPARQPRPPESQPVLPRLRRRDTHFPICLFCCGCCNKSKCGICCKT